MEASCICLVLHHIACICQRVAHNHTIQPHNVIVLYSSAVYVCSASFLCCMLASLNPDLYSEVSGAQRHK